MLDMNNVIKKNKIEYVLNDFVTFYSCSVECAILILTFNPFYLSIFYNDPFIGKYYVDIHT